MTSHRDPFIVHVAGPPLLGGLRQECVRCGHVLQDYSGREIGVVLQPGETEPQPLAQWREGAQVARLGGMSFMIEGRELDDDEQECRPAS